MEDYLKSVSDQMEFINVNDLSDAMPAVFRLCALILTIPLTTASVQRSFSAHKRIKTYQKILQEKLEFWDYLLCQLKQMH